jgi:mannitol-1-/sugar-/sorbitol-6-/2-deoxyglucose-6-phosphatase
MVYTSTMIRAVIFDLDGVLIDSEPLWRKAEVEVYRSIGLPVSEQTFHQTTGIGMEEAVNMIFRMHPWKTPTKQEVAKSIYKKVEELVGSSGKACKGALEFLHMVEHNQLKLGLASSASLKLISIALNKLGIQHFFQSIHSTETEKRAKPDPAVYLSVACELGIKPQECVVVEDSPVGVEAAIRAGMHVVAVVDPHLKNDPHYQAVDMQIQTLVQLTQNVWDRFTQNFAQQ